jgi:large repetitive protein
MAKPGKRDGMSARHCLGAKKSSRTGRHRTAVVRQSAVSQWLRAGAVGLGLGAAVTVGQGTAAAAPDDSSHSSAHANRSGQGAHHSEKTSRPSGTSHPVRLSSPAAPAPTALLKAASQSNSVAAVSVRTATKPTRVAFGNVVGDALATLSGAVREVELSVSRRTTASPSASTPLGVGQSRRATIDHLAVANSARAALTEDEQEAADAKFNMTSGWVPVLGTVHNALRFVSDFVAFGAAVGRRDVADMGDEIADMATDVVGMVPIVGGPLAATIYHMRVGDTPVEPDNHAPVVGDENVTFTGIDAPSGIVTGHVNVTDPDSDQLTYTLGSAPDAAIGTVTVDSATGTFTFTPTTEARFSAWTKQGAAGATFTINASDGQYTAPVTVIAPISQSTAFKVAVLASTDQQDLGNQGLAVAPDGRFYSTTYQTDTAGNLVVLNSDGTYAATIDIASVIPAAFSTAYDVVVGPDGRVFVSSETGDAADNVANETGHGAVVVIDPNNEYAASLFAQTTDPASALAVDASGDVYVANWNNDNITVLNADGSLNHVINSDLLTDGDDSGVAGMALGTDGKLYLTKPALGVIKEINPDGSLANTLELSGTPWSMAFGSNGATYVTDATDGTVGVLDAEGNVIRTISLPEGSNPTDLTIGADGTVYVAYTDTNGATIAAFSAVPIPAPDPTVLGETVPGLPVGSGVSGGLVVAGGVAYQTVIATDPVTGKSTTTVAAISADGTTTFAYADGIATGSVVAGTNGSVYQTIISHDDASGTPLTGVLVISPSGDSKLTDLIAGSPVGPVIAGPDGNAYQIAIRVDADSTYATTVLAITPTGVTTYDITGMPAAVGPGSAVIAPDGTVYVTTIDFDASNSDFTTYVATLTNTGITIHTIDGYATGSVAIATNGRVYQTTAAAIINSETGNYAYSTAASMLTDSGFVKLPDTIAGLPLGSPRAATDGALYQAAMVVDSDTGTSTTAVAKITGTGLTVTFEGLPGTPIGADANILPVVVGADGTLYQTTVGEPDPDTGAVTTYVATKAPGGSVDITELPGEPVGTIVVGPDGVGYQTTYDSGTGITRVAVVTAAGTAVREFDGYPGNPEVGYTGIGTVVIGADGNAYQTVTLNDLVTGDYNTMVVVISPSDVETHVYQGVPSGPAAVGADGAVYQSVSQFDVATQTTYTTVLAVDTSGMTPVSDPITGQAVGPVVVGADGLLYQTVYTEGGAGEYFTAVHVVDPSAPMARSAAALAVQAAATNSATLVGDPIYVGGDPEGLAVSPNGRYLYVANEDGYLSVIDTYDNNSIRTVYTGNDSISVAVHGNFVYVTNRGSNSVSVIDMSNITNPAVQPQAINVGVGSAPFGLAVTPNGKYVYVANSGDGTISVIDTHSNTVIGDIQVGGSPTAIAASPNGTRAYVTNTSGGMSVIDTANNRVKYTIAVNGGYGVAVSPDNKYVYVTDGGVSVIDINAGTVTPIESVFSEWIAVSPSGNRVYVTNTGGNTVSVIDGKNSTVIGDPLYVGYVAGVALSPNSQRLYAVLAGGGGSSVQVIATGDSGTAINTTTKPVPSGGSSTKTISASDVNWPGEVVNAITFALSTWDYFLDNVDDWADTVHLPRAYGNLIKNTAVPGVSTLVNFFEGGFDIAAGKHPITSVLHILSGVAGTLGVVLPILPPQLGVARGLAWTVGTATDALILVLNVTYPDL